LHECDIPKQTVYISLKAQDASVQFPLAFYDLFQKLSVWTVQPRQERLCFLAIPALLESFFFASFSLLARFLRNQ